MCVYEARKSRANLGSLLRRAFIEVIRPCQWNRVVGQGRRHANMIYYLSLFQLGLRTGWNVNMTMNAGLLERGP
jgi:hypothetical protein